MAEITKPVDTQKNFKEGLKGTSLFGGVQVIQIIISIVRSKVAAVLLGPLGVGIMGLLNSVLDLIYGFSNLGLSTSAIREISEAHKENDLNRLSRKSKVFNNLVWCTGLLGTVICLAFSPYWSKATFGNHDYTWTFVFLSVTILFRLLSEGQTALLQGTHRLRDMAKAQVIGNAISLVLTIPCYYFWGIAGIAPSIFIIFVINLLVTWYYANKVKLEKIKVSFRETLQEGRTMLKLGFFISISGLFISGAGYIIRLFISNNGSIEDVGLYTAGFAIVSTYVGMIFTAMSKEYFPRLSSISKNNEEFTMALNQQMQMSILLIGPFICLLMIFCDIGIKILYSNEFLGIDIMVCLAVAGILFKTPSWCCSYAIIAKGDSIVFFFGEIGSIVVKLIANIALYLAWGLNGLGIAFIINYVYYMLQEWAICKYRYKVSLMKEVIKTYIPHFIFAGICLLVVFFFSGWQRYVFGMMPVILSFAYSAYKINEKVNIVSFVKNILKR